MFVTLNPCISARKSLMYEEQYYFCNTIANVTPKNNCVFYITEILYSRNAYDCCKNVRLFYFVTAALCVIFFSSPYARGNKKIHMEQIRTKLAI